LVIVVDTQAALASALSRLSSGQREQQQAAGVEVKVYEQQADLIKKQRKAQLPEVKRILRRLQQLNK
jgi:hypothetical protein